MLYRKVQNLIVPVINVLNIIGVTANAASSKFDPSPAYAEWSE